MTLEDTRRHQPRPDAKPNWQESFYLGWVDVEQRAAGAHHISLAPGRDTHVWSWVMMEGRVIGRSQQHGLPLPAGDFDDLTLGSLRVASSPTLRDLELKAEFDAASVDLTFRALCDPVEIDLNQDDTILSDFHYEAMGMATGAVSVGAPPTARRIPIHAGAWHDHSWGAREFSTNPAHRWLFAVFGEDLAVSVFSFVTGVRRAQFGWVCDAGRVYRVRRADFRAVVNDDGMTPEGCDASIFTEGNRGYRITGRCLASAIMGGKGWFGVDGLTQFECGGRIGRGFLEVGELKSMTPAIRAELALD